MSVCVPYSSSKFKVGPVREMNRVSSAPKEIHKYFHVKNSYLLLAVWYYLIELNLNNFISRYVIFIELIRFRWAIKNLNWTAANLKKAFYLIEILLLIQIFKNTKVKNIFLQFFISTHFMTKKELKTFFKF